jgi:hypothetical protein
VTHRAPSLLVLLLCAACDSHGVSLGHEEPCVADARLLAPELANAELLSPCARIEENVLANAGFEAPVVGACSNGLFCQFPAADVAPWQTNDVNGVIEIWNDGHLGVAAPEGSQLVELDADSQAAVWQDIALEPGALMYWSLLHRGREAVETFELRLGPPEATASQGSFSSAADDWHFYSGLYRVGPSETLTRFSLESRTGTSRGNLLDALVLAPVN